MFYCTHLATRSKVGHGSFCSCFLSHHECRWFSHELSDGNPLREVTNTIRPCTCYAVEIRHIYYLPDGRVLGLTRSGVSGSRTSLSGRKSENGDAVCQSDNVGKPTLPEEQHVTLPHACRKHVCICACVRVRVCACVRACVRACVAVWGSGLCSRFPVETLRVRSPPSTVSHVFLLLLYLWVVTNSQMCMSEYVWWTKKRKKKEGIVAGQKQPLGAVWCKTRLFNSGGQFDQLCNLIGGAILARSTMLAHSRAIIAYGDGRPRSKVCVYMCVCVCMCV